MTHEATKLAALQTVLNESLTKENHDLKARVRELEEAQFSPYADSNGRLAWQTVARQLQSAVQESRDDEERGWSTMQRAVDILQHARTHAARGIYDIVAANGCKKTQRHSGEAASLRHMEDAHTLICAAIELLEE